MLSTAACGSWFGMDNFTREELESALKTIASVISKIEKAKAHIAPKTPPHTLGENRLKAFRRASGTSSLDLNLKPSVGHPIHVKGHLHVFPVFRLLVHLRHHVFVYLVPVGF